jgi:uncharacterized membrane protein (DUF485 family)
MAMRYRAEVPLVKDATAVSVPERIRQVLAFALTVIALILYVAVLGDALVRTYFQGMPELPIATTRFASLLSGLVGAVVTAGFARATRPVSVPLSAPHPLGGWARTGWSTLRPPSRTRIKLLGLSEMLGLHPADLDPDETSSDEEEAERRHSLDAATYLALAYFLVYFLVGLGAFLLAFSRPEVPDLVMNTSWIWVGTIVSSGYAFLGLSPDA